MMASLTAKLSISSKSAYKFNDAKTLKKFNPFVTDVLSVIPFSFNLNLNSVVQLGF